MDWVFYASLIVLAFLHCWLIYHVLNTYKFVKHAVLNVQELSINNRVKIFELEYEIKTLQDSLKSQLKHSHCRDERTRQILND
jgi:uncharacterized membrane protein